MHQTFIVPPWIAEIAMHVSNWTMINERPLIWQSRRRLAKVTAKIFAAQPASKSFQYRNATTIKSPWWAWADALVKHESHDGTCMKAILCLTSQTIPTIHEFVLDPKFVCFWRTWCNHVQSWNDRDDLLTTTISWRIDHCETHQLFSGGQFTLGLTETRKCKEAKEGVLYDDLTNVHRGEISEVFILTFSDNSNEDSWHYTNTIATFIIVSLPKKFQVFTWTRTAGIR